MQKFEVLSLPWISKPISSTFSKTPQELVLKMKSRSIKKIKMFLFIEKNIRGNFDLVYNANFYEEDSIIATHLLAYFFKLYRQKMLSLFNYYF